MDTSVFGMFVAQNGGQGLEVFHTVVEDNASIRSFGKFPVTFFFGGEKKLRVANSELRNHAQCRNPSAYVQTKCREVRRVSPNSGDSCRPLYIQFVCLCSSGID